MSFEKDPPSARLSRKGSRVTLVKTLVRTDGQEGHGMARVRHLRLFLFKILSIHPPSSFALEPRASLLPSSSMHLSLFVGSFSISFSEGMQIFGP